MKDAAGTVIQAEEPTGRFAVRYNIGTVNISKELNLLVKTTQPFYPIGGSGTFDIVVTNAKTTDVPVRLRYGTSYHQPLYSAGSKTFEDKIIPASGTATFTVDVANLARGDYFSAGLFDQSDRLLTFGQEKFYVFYPYAKPVVTIDKNKYLPEENGTLSYTLSYNFLSYINKTSYEVTANIRILDQSGVKVSETSKTLVLTGTGFAEEVPFAAPAKGGRYIAQVEIVSYGKQVGLGASYFEVLTGDFVTIASHYPATWTIGGDNALSFDVKNVSLSTLPSGAIKATLFDPDSTAVWTEEKQFFNLPAGDLSTISFGVPLTGGKFGTYRLKYELSYMGNLYVYYADFPNQVVFDLTLDKLSYKIEREHASQSRAHKQRRVRRGYRGHDRDSDLQLHRYPDRAPVANSCRSLYNRRSDLYFSRNSRGECPAEPPQSTVQVLPVRGARFPLDAHHRQEQLHRGRGGDDNDCEYRRSGHELQHQYQAARCERKYGK